MKWLWIAMIAMCLASFWTGCSSGVEFVPPQVKFPYDGFTSGTIVFPIYDATNGTISY